MTLQQLKYVITVAEKGSISDAAKALFLSQPSLTNSIRELEQEMHLTIFTRTNRGVIVSKEGEIFLGYARQVVEQANLLEERYLHQTGAKRHFCVSAQHYSFAVNAFVDVIKEYGDRDYEFSLRETQTHEIIEDVSQLKSEIGVLYLNDFNEKVLSAMIRSHNLTFHPLFTAAPHVFISSSHPLSQKRRLSLSDLEEFPYLSFEQGEYNSFYFSEEILSTIERKKTIRVRDRATLFNLLIGLNGYTICSGIISAELNGKTIISLPLDVEDSMRIGYITHRQAAPGPLGEAYIRYLRQYAQNY